MFELNKIKLKFKDTKGAEFYRIIRNSVKTFYYRKLSDEKYLNKLFEKNFGKKISNSNPQTFNEKLQWLKLYWRDERAMICSDKYEVRQYINSLGLGYLLNEIYGVYESVNDIDINNLPDRFVLKCTHGSGCNVICKDKKNMNWKKEMKKLKKWMKINYYWFSREWVYKYQKPRIICEKYLENKKFGELIDYKYFCFNGVPIYIMVITERFSKTGLKIDFFDSNWKWLDFERDHPKSGKNIEKPINYKKMFNYAEKLSKEFPFVRVDFYEANKIVFFGEMTFFPGGGFEKFQPEEYDYIFGKQLKLPLHKK